MESLAQQLYRQIEHGDQEHREWLKEAVFNFFDGKPCPLPRGSGTKDRLYREIERLLEENENECEVYRADKAAQPHCECTSLEGTKQPVEKIYNGHRKKYFPKDNPTAFSIPSVVYCHHTIRRAIKENQ